MMKVLRAIGVGLVGLVVGTLFVWTALPTHAQEKVTAELQMELTSLNRLLVGLTTVSVPFDQDYTQLFSSGTGANQADALWQDDRTLAASATEDLDLNASLTDVFGQSVTCTELKALIVKAATGNTNDVDVGGGNTTITGLFGATNDVISVRPGGVLILTAPAAAGIPLTAGSADVLTVTNSSSGTSVDYNIIVLCSE